MFVYQICLGASHAVQLLHVRLRDAIKESQREQKANDCREYDESPWVVVDVATKLFKEML